MNVQAAPGSTGVPVVNQALEPTWVRNGSASTQKAYQAALSFEQTLVEQLARSLTATSGLGDESSQEGEAGAEEGGSSMAGGSELSSTLPQALASGVMNAGGLGLAAELTKGLQDAQGAAPLQASGPGGQSSAVTGAGSQTSPAPALTPSASGQTSPTPALTPSASGQTSSGAAMSTTGGANAADTGGTGA